MSETPFEAAPIPPDELLRLAALRSYDILDTPREQAFDDITRLAAHLCGVPIALVSLVDSARQWFKSSVGLDAAQTPRNISFCGHAISQSGLFIIEDALRDPRFAQNPLVVSPPHVRFYAGAPLRTSDGLALGTLCVIDHKPHQLSAEQQGMLLALARQTMAVLELHRALAQTSRLNQYRSRVMATVGHDLKQPLQVIAMLLDVLQPRIATADQHRVGRMNKAIDDLSSGLDALASASAGAETGSPFERARFPLNAVLDRLGDNWRYHAERKGLRLRIVPTSAEVVSDASVLTTILSNLIGNAIKYTDAGCVLVGCRRRGAAIAVEIVDTGCGIPAEEFETIFTVFRQLHPGTEGLGLGLSIVAEAARMLGHPVKVSSVIGKGSRFSLELPLVSAALRDNALHGSGIECAA